VTRNPLCNDLDISTAEAEMRRSGGGMLRARKKEEVLSGQMTGTYDAARRRYLHNHLRQAGCGTRTWRLTPDPVRP